MTDEAPRGQTMAQKVLARTSGRDRVAVGEFVTARPDRLMCHEAFTMCASQLRQVGIDRLDDPDRVYVILDHFFPAPTEAHARAHASARRLVERFGIRNFLGHAGICHQVMVEGGHVRPGDLVVGTDSHSTTYGAVGAAGAGIGVTEMTYALATGELWFQVPDTVRFDLVGVAGAGAGVMAKDVVLAIAGRFGTDVAQYAAIEYAGPVAERLSVASRMTLANMGVELGAKFAMVAADEVTTGFLAKATTAASADRAEPVGTAVPVAPFGPDPDAGYGAVHEVDVSALVPQVACPHNPGNVAAVEAVGDVAVQQAFLGSCTNARLEDFAVAAAVLRGRRVHPGVRLIVTPASQQVFLDAVRAGYVEVLAAAGAHLTPAGCGACPGGHLGLVGPGEVCVSSTNRNFQGRMGSPEAEVYLASPATVAASAVTGRLTDPREFWEGHTL